MLLAPLVSWATPAHVPEGYLLKGSIRQCWQRLGWRPDIVVGDLGYIQQQTKKEIRQGWRVATNAFRKQLTNLGAARLLRSGLSSTQAAAFTKRLTGRALYEHAPAWSAAKKAMIQWFEEDF